MEEAPKWGSKVEKERRNRILLSVYAYSYELQSNSIISDGDYDKLSAMIDPSVSTGNKVMDKFFREKFEPHTGMWIRSHPDLLGINQLYMRMFQERHKNAT
jgi:hypothetical protein